MECQKCGVFFSTGLNHKCSKKDLELRKNQTNEVNELLRLN